MGTCLLCANVLLHVLARCKPRCVQVAALPVLAAARLATQLTWRSALLRVIGEKLPAVVCVGVQQINERADGAGQGREAHKGAHARRPPPPAPLLRPACPRLLWLCIVAVCAAAGDGRGGPWASGLAHRAMRSELASVMLPAMQQPARLPCAPTCLGRQRPRGLHAACGRVPAWCECLRLGGSGWGQALGNERSNRIQKEKMFVELLQEERSARLQVPLLPASSLLCSCTYPPTLAPPFHAARTRARRAAAACAWVQRTVLVHVCEWS